MLRKIGFDGLIDMHYNHSLVVKFNMYILGENDGKTANCG